MNKTFTLLGLSFLFIFGVSLQKLSAAHISGTPQQKQSYLITKEGKPADCTLCETALNKIIIDRYRYIDERREVKLVAENGTTLYELTLFSGDELQKKYGKPISPLNTPGTKGSSGCELILYPSGDLKVKSCK